MPSPNLGSLQAVDQTEIFSGINASIMKAFDTAFAREENDANRRLKLMMQQRSIDAEMELRKMQHGHESRFDILKWQQAWSDMGRQAESVMTPEEHVELLKNAILPGLNASNKVRQELSSRDVAENVLGVRKGEDPSDKNFSLLQQARDVITKAKTEEGKSHAQAVEDFTFGDIGGFPKAEPRTEETLDSKTETNVEEEMDVPMGRYEESAFQARRKMQLQRRPTVRAVHDLIENQNPSLVEAARKAGMTPQGMYHHYMLGASLGGSDKQREALQVGIEARKTALGILMKGEELKEGRFRESAAIYREYLRILGADLAFQRAGTGGKRGRSPTEPTDIVLNWIKESWNDTMRFRRDVYRDHLKFKHQFALKTLPDLSFASMLAAMPGDMGEAGTKALDKLAGISSDRLKEVLGDDGYLKVSGIMASLGIAGVGNDANDDDPKVDELQSLSAILNIGDVIGQAVGGDAGKNLAARITGLLAGTAMPRLIAGDFGPQKRSSLAEHFGLSLSEERNAVETVNKIREDLGKDTPPTFDEVKSHQAWNSLTEGQRQYLIARWNSQRRR